MKKWVDYKKDYSGLDVLMKEFSISEITARVLINRDINTIEKASSFFKSDIKHLNDPFEMKDMSKAVRRINEAIEKDEKICIYGDYDVDGIASISILYNFLAKREANISYYIPNRIEEGYGLNENAIKRIINDNVALIITVDCGIKSLEEIELCNQASVDVIVTDHHKCGDTIPKAYAVLNPLQTECKYQFKLLAGAGIVFKLIQALSYNTVLENDILDYIDLAALATVADVVPLIGENRIIVKQGLEYIKKTQNIGLKALITTNGIKAEDITSYYLGFVISPRLNASGRIDDASIAVELLTTTDEEKALEIAQKLNSLNRKRQEIEMSIIESANQIIKRDINLDDTRIIVLTSDSWHIGVLGIVAARITQKYNLPSILISLKDGLGKGSARSLAGFNIYNAIDDCGDLLEKYGGHELAAGLAIKEENIDIFKKRINKTAIEMLGQDKLYNELLVDYKLDKNLILIDIYNEIIQIEPFGSGNPKPLFVFRNLSIASMKRVGNGKHLSLDLFDGLNNIKAIGFNYGYAMNHIAVKDRIDIICSVERNVWMGEESIQLFIKDIKLSKYFPAR